MDDLAAGVETIDVLAGRTFPYWATRVAPPAVVVGWPDPLTYDATMTRGADLISDIPVIVLVGNVDARSSRDQLARHAAGGGAQSVKAAIESFAATAYHSARVTRAEFGVMTVAAVEYLAATFYVDVIGQGA